MEQFTSKPLRFAAAAALLVMAMFASDASGCPNCRESLPNGKQKNGQPAEPQVAQGYAWSIYLMIGVPFAMVAAMGGAAFVLIKRANMN